jgi:hypothetical protein
MTQTTTATSRAAEMSETVLMPTTHEFLPRKIRQNAKISRKDKEKE